MGILQGWCVFEFCLQHTHTKTQATNQCVNTHNTLFDSKNFESKLSFLTQKWKLKKNFTQKWKFLPKMSIIWPYFTAKNEYLLVLCFLCKAILKHTHTQHTEILKHMCVCVWTHVYFSWQPWCFGQNFCQVNIFFFIKIT